MVQLHAAHILYVSYVLLHMCLCGNFAKFCFCPLVKTVCACRRTSAAFALDRFCVSRDPPYPPWDVCAATPLDS